MATRYQRSNQKPYIKGQTTQWPQDTKWVLRIRTSKDRQHNGHKIPKGYSESVHQRTDNTMATRYQMGTQNTYIKEETTQWPQDTKWVLRIRTSKDRQHNGHKIPNGYSESVLQRTDNTMATRYQRGTQNPYIKGQTTQWPQDTKCVLRISTSKDRQHNGHKIPNGYSESVHQRTDNTMATRYQRGTQNSYIKGQTTQWPQDTNGYSESVHQRTDNTMATRYQMCTQNPYIKGQTTQWPQDTKGVIGIRTSKDRQHNGHKIPNGYSESVHQRTDNTMATRYQMGTQNPYIKGQTTQWPQDTKEVLRIRTSKDRQHNGHKIPNGYSESVHQRTDNTMATRYQMCTQNPYIKGQTTQWPHDTKGVIGIRTSKDRQHNGHKIPNGYSECVHQSRDNTMATRYQMGTQNQYIKGQTTQWPQDTKEVLRIRTSKDRQHNGHKIPNGYSESVHQRTDNTMATRYQRGTQNPYIKGQTTQWPQDTKWVLRIRTSKDRQHNGYKIPKGYSESVHQRTDNTMATRYQMGTQNRTSKDRQHNGHKIPNGYSESVHQRRDNTMATRYQMGTQNPYIKGQTTQWPQDTKEVLRIRTSKDRQHKVKRQKDKQRSTKHTYKTKDRVTRSPLKTGGGLRCSSFLSKCSSYDINSLS